MAFVPTTSCFSVERDFTIKKHRQYVSIILSDKLLRSFHRRFVAVETKRGSCVEVANTLVKRALKYVFRVKYPIVHCCLYYKSK